MATSRKTTTQTLAKAAAKTAAKPAPSPKRGPSAAAAAKPAANRPKAAAQKAAPAPSSPSPKAGKAAKLKKPKLVRDSFTIPKSEYEVIDALKLRAGKLGQAPKKSELLRAGLKALAAMDDQALQASIAAVPNIKTGRPAA